MPLFCGTELAERIESAEAQLIYAATRAAQDRGAPGWVRPVAGGFACFAEDGSPMNKIVGLGFRGVPDARILDEIEQCYSESGAPVNVELSSLADPGVAALLADRGYRVAGFEHVLGASLPLEHAVSTDVDVRPATAEELDTWVDVVLDGFTHPDGEGVPSHDEFPRDTIARAMRDVQIAGATAYVGLRRGAVAGGGSIRMTAGVAQLCGAATAPAHRRRGVQSALMTARLRDATNAGCDIAVVTTAPGSTSQKNVQRNGFHLLYIRAMLVKPGQVCGGSSADS